MIAKARQAAVGVAREVRSWPQRLEAAFIRSVDAESVSGFQTMYYVLIMSAGLYLLLFADAPPQNVEPVMGHIQYQFWLYLNVVCPSMTLLGKALMKRAAKAEPGDLNSAMGAAWLQVVGDGGVWGAIIIYVTCLYATTWWGQGLYGAFFVLMGIPGGGMFTLRSARRIVEIRRRERRLP